MDNTLQVGLKNIRKCVPEWREVERLFQSMWPDLVLDEHYRDDVNLPPVIVAMEDEELIGGLAFSRYQEPNGTEQVIWINAVFIAPKWRGKGIARQLINRAVEQVSAKEQAYLYANTNVSPLYISIGWFVVDIECKPHHHVMAIPLAN
ncbi:GNAT family N-acetyltransferase [Vibrio bivalvicida]|uniref:GNAT family N-acetyltransferase n=1 Tax=Vibrio bivalvicida TaxID=1276888 RepID=UPI0009EF1403|nr:GNAT family N-acetyltransferase [Vibrio bivalvicida]